MFRFKDDKEIQKLVEGVEKSEIADSAKMNAGNFSRLLREMVEEALDEGWGDDPDAEQIMTEAPDPEAVQQVMDWGKNNDLEVIERKPGVLVVRVPPAEIDGKKKDDRARVVQKMSQDLESQGFIYDSTRGGSVGRFVKLGVRGQSTQLIVLVKSTVATGGGAAASAGMEAEVKLASYISDNFANLGVSAKTAGAGHGSDLEIMASNKEPMTIEVKTSMGADFGQFRIGYSTDSRTWVPSETKGFLKNKELFQDIFDTVVGPYMDKNAQFTDEMLQSSSLQASKDGIIKSLKPMVGTGDFKKQIQASWFGGKPDVRVEFDFAKISNYYAAKGDRFIQINNRGLYALNAEDAADIGVPNFADAGLKGIVRIRVKPHMGYDGTHSFTVAIKLGGKLGTSPLNLTNSADLDKVVKRFLSA